MARRRIHDERTGGLHGAHSVSHVRSDDGGLARAEHSFLSVDPDRQMTLDNGPGLLLGVLVLVHVWRSRRDLVAR